MNVGEEEATFTGNSKVVRPQQTNMLVFELDHFSTSETVIFSLTATDLDDDNTISPLTFSLSGGDGNFELFSTTENAGGNVIKTDYTSPNWSEFVYC